jgi:hypothetical protein
LRMDPTSQPDFQQLGYHLPMLPHGAPLHPPPIPPHGVPLHPPPMPPHGVPLQAVYPPLTPPHAISPHEPQGYHGVPYPYPPMPPYPLLHSYGQPFQGWPMYAPYMPALPVPAPALVPPTPAPPRTSTVEKASPHRATAALEAIYAPKKYLNVERRPGGKLLESRNANMNLPDLDLKFGTSRSM